MDTFFDDLIYNVHFMVFLTQGKRSLCQNPSGDKHRQVATKNISLGRFARN